MADFYKAKSGIRQQDRVVVKEMTVKGSTSFMVNSPNFILSPLTKEAKLYIKSIHAGVDDVKPVAILEPNDYNKIVGAVPNTEFYVDTDETFYVKW